MAQYKSENLSTSANCIMNGFTHNEDIDWETFDGVMNRNMASLPNRPNKPLTYAIARFILKWSTPNCKTLLVGSRWQKSEADRSLLTYATNNTPILTYPLLAQLNTFFPQHPGDIDWKNLRPLQFHSKSSPLAFNTLQSALQAYNKPTIILIAGYQLALDTSSSKDYMVVGELINGPWA